MWVTRMMVALASATLGGLGMQAGADVQESPARDVSASSISRPVLVSANSIIVPMADSPSPTLGSTPQAGVNPPDDNDGDAADYSQVPLGVLAPLTIVAVVGGSIVFYLVRRSRRNRPSRTGGS
jgi:hypothetical protein